MNSNQGTVKRPSQVFAMKVLDAFRAAGRLTDTDVAAAGGPSDSYMTSLRKAAAGSVVLPEPRGNTQKAIETAARWAPGSTLKVWNGDDPTPVSQVSLEKVSVVGSGSVGKYVSDQELIDRLTGLLDERNAVDMFVSDALLAVEQRLAELRMERNRLAHGIGTTRDPRPQPAPVDDAELDTIVSAVLARIATQLGKGETVTMGDFNRAVRQGASDSPDLQLAADEDEVTIESEQGHDEHP